MSEFCMAPFFFFATSDPLASCSRLSVDVHETGCHFLLKLLQCKTSESAILTTVTASPSCLQLGLLQAVLTTVSSSLERFRLGKL